MAPSYKRLVDRTLNPAMSGSIPTGVTICRISSIGRASPCHGEGCGFKPRILLHFYNKRFRGAIGRRRRFRAVRFRVRVSAEAPLWKNIRPRSRIWHMRQTKDLGLFGVRLPAWAPTSGIYQTFSCNINLRLKCPIDGIGIRA